MSGLAATLFAAGQRSTRYALQAVLWEVEADRLRLVATDNRRLAVAEVPAEKHGEPFDTVPVRRLLSASALALLAKVAAGQEGRVRVVFGVRQVVFQVGTATLRLHCAEGEFPNWHKVIPERPRYLVPVAVGTFLSAARQAAAVRTARGRQAAGAALSRAR